jgi:O-antigen ligase
MIGLKTGMASAHAPLVEADDRLWPQGLSRREFRINALWLVFLVFTSNMYVPIGIGPLPRFAWFPADILAIAFFLRNQTLFVALAKRNALLLSWPVLACASTLWSGDPNTSFYHGLQLFTTMLVGLMLASQISIARLLQLLFVTGFIVTVLCFLAVVLMPSTAYFHTGEWQGLFGHKNALGGAMAAEITAGICLFLYGWRRAFVAGAVAFSTLVLIMSGSGSALVVAAIPFVLLPPMFAYRKGVAAFMMTLGLVIMALAAVLFVIDLYDINVVDVVLGRLGKDSTLSGRTVLWDFAIDAFEYKPWLGYGYKGYWSGADSTAYLLKFVVEQDLWMFHNNFLEVLVGFGVIGPVVLIGTLLFAYICALRSFAESPTYINAWPVIYLVVVTLLCFSENPLFNNHGVHELVLVSIITARGLKGWVRQGGELVRVETRPPIWTTAEPIGDRLPAR